MRWILLVFIALGLLPIGLAAETPPNKQLDQFFQALVDHKSDSAFGGLLTGSLLAKFHPDIQGKFETQYSMALKHYGPPVGFECLSYQPVGDSIFKITYALKFEYLPLIWLFIYYKPHDKWILNTINFNDQLEGL